MAIYCKNYTSAGDFPHVVRQLQQGAAEDAASPGEGRAWVIVRFSASVERLPREGERVTLETWAGESRHAFYPRYYRLLSGEGRELLRASSLWVVLDVKERTMLTASLPTLRGGTVTGHELPLPGVIKMPAGEEIGAFTVPPEYIDGNGHMNNACYFDLAETVINGRGEIKSAVIEFTAEALEGDTILLHRSCRGEEYFLEGTVGGKRCFRLKETFKNISCG